MSGDSAGLELPLHRSLAVPILLGGAPRSLAIVNGTLATAVGIGLQQWLPGAFEKAGSHFESAYFLTLVWLPPPEAQARMGRLLYEATGREGVDWRQQRDVFVTETDRFLALLEGALPEIAWLDDAATLTYMHGTVSNARHPVAVPAVPMHLDAWLADTPLSGGIAPRLGEAHVRAVTVRGFPGATWPGMLDELNRLGFGYRWVTRFVCLDKADAERELTRLRRQWFAKRELTRLRRQWFAKRKGVVTLLHETLFQQESPLVDNDAVAFGYVTVTVVVRDADAEVVEAQRKAMERVVRGRGWLCRRRSMRSRPGCRRCRGTATPTYGRRWCPRWT